MLIVRNRESAVLLLKRLCSMDCRVKRGNDEWSGAVQLNRSSL